MQMYLFLLQGCLINDYVRFVCQQAHAVGSLCDTVSKGLFSDGSFAVGR
jgi:hypothetical protein